MKRYLVLDTNILYNKNLRRFLGPALEIVQGRGDSICVPKIVASELDTQYDEKLREYKELLERMVKMYQKEFCPNQSIGWREQILNSLPPRRNSAQELEDLGIQILAYPDIPHEDILGRIGRAQKPFGAKESKDKGYKDFLIWRTVLDLAGTVDDEDEVFFITSNSSDFFVKTKEKSQPPRLHADFLVDVEVEELGSKVSVYRTVEDCLTEQYQTETALVEKARAIEHLIVKGEFEPIQDKAALLEEVAVSLADAPLDDCIHEISIEDGELNISAVEDVGEVYFESLHAPSANTIILKALLELNVEVSGTVSRVDAINLEEFDGFSYDWDDEETFVEVSGSIVVWAPVSIYLGLNFDDGQELDNEEDQEEKEESSPDEDGAQYAIENIEVTRRRYAEIIADYKVFNSPTATNHDGDARGLVLQNWPFRRVCEKPEISVTTTRKDLVVGDILALGKQIDRPEFSPWVWYADPNTGAKRVFKGNQKGRELSKLLKLPVKP